MKLYFVKHANSDNYGACPHGSAGNDCTCKLIDGNPRKWHLRKDGQNNAETQSATVLLKSGEQALGSTAYRVYGRLPRGEEGMGQRKYARVVSVNRWDPSHEKSLISEIHDLH